MKLPGLVASWHFVESNKSFTHTRCKSFVDGLYIVPMLSYCSARQLFVNSLNGSCLHTSIACKAIPLSASSCP